VSSVPAESAAVAAEERRWRLLPPRLRPRAEELKGRGELRLLETLVLVLVGVVLATATINDLARQAGINHRLVADLATWRHYTGHDYHNISIDQETLGVDKHREVLCGNTSPGAPKSRTQICLAIWGPVVDGMRTVHGGWYLPAYVENDLPDERYGCFGIGGLRRCSR
jgi:hypothetical protein